MKRLLYGALLALSLQSHAWELHTNVDEMTNFEEYTIVHYDDDRDIGFAIRCSTRQFRPLIIYVGANKFTYGVYTHIDVKVDDNDAIRFEGTIDTIEFKLGKHYIDYQYLYFIDQLLTGDNLRVRLRSKEEGKYEYNLSAPLAKFKELFNEHSHLCTVADYLLPN